MYIKIITKKIILNLIIEKISIFSFLICHWKCNTSLIFSIPVHHLTNLSNPKPVHAIEVLQFF